nr:type II CAAX endopeptidase family protein [Nakamurella flavida]
MPDPSIPHPSVPHPSGSHPVGSHPTTSDPVTPDPWARSTGDRRDPAGDLPTGPLPVVGDRAATPAISAAPDPWSDRSAPARSGASERAHRPRTPWTVTDVLAGLGVALLLSIVLAVPFTLDGGRTGITALVVAGLLPIWGGLTVAVLWASRAHGSGHLASDLGLHFRWIDLAIGLAAGLALRIASVVVAVVVTAIAGSPATGNSPLPLAGSGTGAVVVVAVATVLIAPVVEELFFRGLGLRATLASWGRRDARAGTPGRDRRTGAALVTAVLFAVLHLSEVADGVSLAVLFPTLVLAGLVLAALTLRTGRLGPAIVTHVVFNGTAVLAALLIG